MTEAELILKTKTPTAVETRDPVDAQLNSYDAGVELFKTTCTGSGWKVLKREYCKPRPLSWYDS